MIYNFYLKLQEKFQKKNTFKRKKIIYFTEIFFILILF